MTRRIFHVFLSLTALALLSAVMNPIAAGQDLPRLRHILQLPEPIPAVDAGIVPLPSSGRSIFNEKHWIVSGRHCQQRRHGCDHDCCFEYVRSDWDGCATESSDTEFHRWLKPGVPVCIMVHGSFVTADTVAEDSKNTFRWLRRAAPHLHLQVVFLTWASEGLLTLNPAIAGTSAVPGLDVAILGRRAEFNGIRLVKLIQSISPQSPICLIGHSHGARIVASGLNLMGGGELCGVKICEEPSHQIRTILAGAAIDHDWLCPRQRYEYALNATECLLNIRVRKDWALMIYPLRRPFSKRALGSTGFTERDLMQFGRQASQVCNYDLSEMIGYGHIWPEFYQHQSIADELVNWIYFRN